MATPKQLAANRLNALKSTGPRTAAGKIVSAMNGLKSGVYAESHIIRGEDPAALEALIDLYTRRWNPFTPEEQLLVDTLVRADWQIRRLNKADSQLWEHGINRAWRPTEDTSLGQVFNSYDRVFGRLQRLISAAERSHRAARQELEHIQAARQAELAAAEPEPEPLPEPVPPPDQPPSLSPEIGFVPSTSPAHLAVPAISQSSDDSALSDPV